MGIENGRTYKIKNKKSNTFLDLSGSDGHSIIGWEGPGGDNQKWTCEQRGDEWTLKNNNGGKYLDVAPGVEADNGAGVAVSENAKGWHIQQDSEHNDAYRILVPGSRHPGINLDLSDHGNSANGTPVHLWGKYKAGVNQLWLFEEV